VKLQAYAYVDGSYNPVTSYMGSAVLLFVGENSQPHRLAFQRRNEALQNYGANIAEMNAVKTAIKAARSNGITDLSIYHDWNGLEFFSHKANIKPRHQPCPCYAQYADFIERSRKNMRVRFIKVKAHSSNALNTLADIMARSGGGAVDMNLDRLLTRHFL
jgi:ribonuclease HI